MAPAMLCKASKNRKHGVTRGKSNEIKSKLACIFDASESTRLRMEESPPNYREDRVAGKGNKSLQHYNLVHTCIPMLSSCQNSRSKGSSGQGMGKIGEFRRGT